MQFVLSCSKILLLNNQLLITHSKTILRHSKILLTNSKLILMRSKLLLINSKILLTYGKILLLKGKKQILNSKNKITSSKNTSRINGHLLTAVWRNWGFRRTLKLVLYLEVRSLIYTFGLPNPQLTPSHETLNTSFVESRMLNKI